MPAVSSWSAAASNSQKHFGGHCSLRRALGGPCRKASGWREHWRRLGLEGAQVPPWGPSWCCLHPPTPPSPSLACLISHQASAGPGKTPSPKPLWPLWPRGGAAPLPPPPHPLLGPPWPPALHSPQVGARARRQPPAPPAPCQVPASVCSTVGGWAGAWLLAQRTRGLHSHQSVRPRGPQAVWTHLSLAPARAPF